MVPNLFWGRYPKRHFEVIQLPPLSKVIFVKCLMLGPFLNPFGGVFKNPFHVMRVPFTPWGNLPQLWEPLV